MLAKSVEKALNEQVHREFFAAYLYLAMSAHFDAGGFGGFAQWMRKQAREETGHAMRLFDYVLDRGGRVTLAAIEQPPADFGSALDAFQQALDHEREVTAQIHRLYELAAKESDPATQVALQWFIQEQVEEEKSAATIVDQLKLAGDNRAALLILDRELGSRQDAD